MMVVWGVKRYQSILYRVNFTNKDHIATFGVCD